jgi:hypothetical protein
MMSWLHHTWGWWVDRLSVREHPAALAVVRIALSAVVLFDLFQVGRYGLPPMLWSPVEAGGTIDLTVFKHVPEVYAFLTPAQAAAWGPTIAWALFYGCVASIAAFGAGLLTRFSGLLFVVLYAQTAMINDTADRGIDRMIRIMILLLVVSGSAGTMSVDARVRTGRWCGDGSLIAAWPRYLMIGQLILMYWCAGAEKFALSWFPWGGYTALYVILQDPVFAVTDFSFLDTPWLFWTTQVGTAVSHMWEWSIPVLLLAFFYRCTRERPGALRAAFNALDVRTGYVVVGVVFHLALALTLRLGIFPAAMLALYPVFFHPDEIRSVARRLGWRRSSKSAVQEVALGHG